MATSSTNLEVPLDSGPLDDAGRDTSHPQYLDPSELGTKEYWETFYARSLEHISSKRVDHDHHHRPAAQSESDNDDGDDDGDDDPGTSWFSEHDAPGKILRFLTSRRFPFSPRNLSRRGTKRRVGILDLGTGNGSMLALLRTRGGFSGAGMVGVDYSAGSVRLARELQRGRLHSAYEGGSEDEDDEDEDADGEADVLASTISPEEGDEDEDQDIRFEEWDILDPENESALLLDDNSDCTSAKRIDWFPYDRGGFDIVLDKGTFDAISLSDDVITTTTDTETDRKGGRTIQRRICERYPGIASRLVRKGGFLVVTSCNWTEEELIRWFTLPSPEAETRSSELQVWARVEYPRFRFGGQEGQGVCTVCFQRV